MIIYVKNKHTLRVDDFKFKCCVGKKGISKKKIEGDLKTPVGIFKLGPLFFRKDKVYLKWISNLKLPLKKGDRGLNGNYYLGLDEFEDMSFTIHLLRENELFIDVGANLGSYTLLASGLSGANSIAYEPVPDVFNNLMHNIEVNKLVHKTKLRKLALSNIENESKYLIFSTDKGCMNSFVDETYFGKKEFVKVSSLDAEMKNKNPILIKIDAEKFEEDVIKGSLKTLSNPSLLGVIIESSNSFIHNVFTKEGFIKSKYDPINRKINFIEKRNPGMINYLYLKEAKINEIKKRCKNAPKRKIFGSVL